MENEKFTKYLESLTKDYLFDEFSNDYIEKNSLDFLKGIAIPFKPGNLIEFKEGGLDLAKIVDNMAVVLGANIEFPYKDAYLKYMAKFFDENLINVFSSRGAEMIIAKKYRLGTAYYRAALLLDGKDKMAMFGYACACREWYLSLEGEDNVDDLITLLKAETMEYFENTVITYPQFSPSYYYLGFAYLNMGLYAKAQFIWTRFVELTPAGQAADEVLEIKEKLAELEDPVQIEAGINKLETGDYKEGLKILEPYVESKYQDWWPLHYYLASAYQELDLKAEAIEGFKRVLALDPSNFDACQALAKLYAEAGDDENALKYANKCDILIENTKAN